MSGTAEDPQPRQAVRAVVLDREERILLMRFEHGGHSWWATPGGGMETGETQEETLRRELLEEAGIALEVPPIWIWNRLHTFEFNGRWFRQSERFALVRLTREAGTPTFSAQQLAEEAIAGHRWWTADELAASAETFAPTRLAALFAALLRDGPPPVPFDTGA